MLYVELCAFGIAALDRDVIVVFVEARRLRAGHAVLTVTSGISVTTSMQQSQALDRPIHEGHDDMT